MYGRYWWFVSQSFIQIPKLKEMSRTRARALNEFAAHMTSSRSLNGIYNSIIDEVGDVDSKWLYLLQSILMRLTGCLLCPRSRPPIKGGIEPSSAPSQSPHSVSPSPPLTSVLAFVVSASCAAGVTHGTVIGEAGSNVQALPSSPLPIPRLLLVLIIPSCLIGIPIPFHIQLAQIPL